MSKNISFKIVTPTQTIFDGAVEHFTVPGALGGFQVLLNHAPIVSKLVPGLLKFKELTGSEEHYYVSGGFLELHSNSGIVLADSIVHASKINVDEVEAQMVALRGRYSAHELGTDEFHHELDTLTAKLNVARAN